MNCCVLPAATLAEVGDREMDSKTGGPTVSAAEPCADPEVAVILAVPTPTPTARPFEPTDATPVAVDDHVADEVKSWVLPSVYVPVAMNC